MRYVLISTCGVCVVCWAVLAGPAEPQPNPVPPPERDVGTTAARAENHWAFQPVERPALPAVKDEAWPRTSIDRFILAGLESQGLAPSPPADKRTLVRRATFDLVGLPPTPEEIALFEADQSLDAFAQVVDRLLASPHYGERWGRYWLDVARYADTKGYVFFEDSNYPWSYTYRDYVIRAFNEDLPYNQFVREQLAADSLPLGQDRRPLAALGFLTLGGRFMNNLDDVLDDRIDVVTRGLLGLTVSCARCHDHKFDPIPTADYYSLYGVFASSVEPTVPPLFADPPQTEEYAAFEKELACREQKLKSFVEAKHAELVGSARTRAAEYLLAAHAARDLPDTEEFMLLADTGDLNPKMVYRWQVYLERTRRAHHPVLAPWHALAAIPQGDFAAQAAALASRWASQPDPARPINPLVAKSFADAPPQTLAEAAQRYGELFNAVEKAWQEAARQAAAANTTLAALADPVQEELRQVLYAPDSPPSVPLNPIGDLELLPDRPSQAQLKELLKAVETWRATGPGAPPRAMVLVDTPVPYQPRVFVRGSPSNLGEAVPRRFLGVLAGDGRRAFEKGSGRVELAEAIVDKRNPLAARVIVNRIWLYHFGQALVGTPSDFGLRSDPPTHPELVDHLATLFVEGGWSLKLLHRRIMLSAAYQQASRDRPECRPVDPENRLLWRMNRRRLDFEATRDAILAVAGTLDRSLGGPAVQLFADPSSTRRTVYGFIDRLNLPGLWRTFDFPSPDSTSPHRDTTTVAPQALFLMNHALTIESARKLLERPQIAGESDPDGRVARLHLVLYGREPTDDDLALAREFLGHPGAPGPAAWVPYVQALLLANEFVFVD